MLNFELEIDVESIILKEDIDNSFREAFDIQNFSIDLSDKVQDIDSFFQEEFSPIKQISFGVEIDSDSSVYDNDFRKFFGLHSFNIFCEDNNIQNMNKNFQEFFNVQNRDLDVSLLEKFKPPTVENTTEEVVEPIIQIENTVEVETVEEVLEQDKFPFRIELSEDGTVFDYDFRKHFDIHNFETCLDRDKSVNDLLFEEHFDVNLEPTYDYDIINNLKRNLNSRKIITRDEVPDKEPDIFSIDESKKKSLSLDESLEKTKSVIKEKTFYKIVEADELISEKVVQEQPIVQTPNLDEFEQKINGLEQKYEDLLQKTKDQYENQMNRMAEDFTNFRNNVSQQISRMAMISTSAGGGAVNILDMDDVDKSNLQNGYTLSYNSALNKFQFIDLGAVGSSATFDLMESDVFVITQTDINNGYLDLSFPADPNYYDISELHINGIMNTCPDEYDFLTTSRIDITNLVLMVGDKVRIVYIKS